MKITYDYTINLTRADIAKIVTDLLGDEIPKGHVVLPTSIEAHCAYTDYGGHRSGYDIDFKVGPPPQPKKKTTKKK